MDESASMCVENCLLATPTNFNEGLDEVKNKIQEIQKLAHHNMNSMQTTHHHDAPHFAHNH